jgi:hypothetical protein
MTELAVLACLQASAVAAAKPTSQVLLLGMDSPELV